MWEFHWSWWLFSWPWHSKHCVSFPFFPKQICFKHFCEGEFTSLLNSFLSLVQVCISRHLRVSWFQKMESICIVSDNSGQAQESWRVMVLLIKVLPRDPVHGGIRSFRGAEIVSWFYFWCIEAFWVAFAYYSFENTMVFLGFKETLWLLCCGLPVAQVRAVCPRVGVSVPAHRVWWKTSFCFPFLEVLMSLLVQLSRLNLQTLCRLLLLATFIQLKWSLFVCLPSKRLSFAAFSPGSSAKGIVSGSLCSLIVWLLGRKWEDICKKAMGIWEFRSSWAELRYSLRSLNSWASAGNSARLLELQWKSLAHFVTWVIVILLCFLGIPWNAGTSGGE